MNKIALSIIVALILINCNYKVEKQVESNKIIKLDNIAVLDNSKLERLEKATKTQLSNKEMNDVEEILNQSVDDYNAHSERHFISRKQSKESDSKISLDNYKRQYIPYINQKGEKEVWIYCLCETHGSESWKTNVLFTAGGGDCYFQVTINLSQRKFYNFIPNGPA